MAKVYFCGTDPYECLPLNRTQNSGKISPKPQLIRNVSDIEFTHFYSVYQKLDTSSPYSWYVYGLGLPETQVFSSAHRIKQVAACKNSVIGLSEDGKLYRISLEADDNRELLSLRTSTVKIDEDTMKVPFKSITANENSIYGIQPTAEISRIYKIKGKLECIAEFPGKYIEELSVGYGHFVALSDTGALWNWGHGGRSELATSNYEPNVMKVCESPKRIEFFDDLPCVIVKIVCGGWHTLALTSEGDIYSWGWNESGQLGHSASNSSKSLPYPIDLGSAEDPVTDISAGSRHSVALLKSGTVYSWGRSEEGQTGNKKMSTGTPTEVTKYWDGVACQLKCSKWATFIYTDTKEQK